MRRTTNLRSLRSLAVAGGLGLFGATIASASPSARATPPKAKIEGVATNLSGECPDLRFQIGEARVVTNAQTVYDGGSCRDIDDGDALEVEGSLSADGELTAWEVDFD